MSLHDLPPEIPGGAKVVTCNVRVWPDPLNLIKSCNKLPNVLARSQADEAGADEALLLDSMGQAVCASSANLFWISEGVVCTPPLSSGVLPGVTRATVLDLCKRLRIPSGECVCPVGDILDAEGIFLTISSRGLLPVASVDERIISRSKTIDRLVRAYGDLVVAETQAST
jgi:branched-subunit amino acid aminotransferase/4-amino-4-deoxychorismate lyase